MEPSQIFSHWGQVRSDLFSTIDMFDESELTFQPFKGSWPIGQIMLHIADCEDNWLHGVVRHEYQPWLSYKLADFPSKPQIKQVLERAHLKTIKLLEDLNEDDLDQKYKTPEGENFRLRWIIWHVMEHEIHHRGELSLALGLLGRQGLDV
jgi:uncharacterized damage-inducible protein DinB